MLIGETIRVALGALRANKLRSLLTMLGIVIGVAAVIAVVALGRGAQQAVNDRIAALGTTLLTVNPGQARTGGIASVARSSGSLSTDAKAVDEHGCIVARAARNVGNLQVVYLNKNTSTPIVGATSNYLEVRKYTWRWGRMFTNADDDGRQRVAVVGHTVVNNLGLHVPRGAHRRDDPHSWHAVHRHRRVRARRDRRARSRIRTTRSSFRSTRRASACSATTGSASISVLAASEDEIPDAMAEIERVLRRQHQIRPGQHDDFQIRNAVGLPATTQRDDAGVQPPARRHRGGLAARRRHRHHEHHARVGHRAHARDRHPQGARRDPARTSCCSS